MGFFSAVHTRFEFNSWDKSFLEFPSWGMCFVSNDYLGRSAYCVLRIPLRNTQYEVRNMKLACRI